MGFLWDLFLDLGEAFLNLPNFCGFWVASLLLLIIAGIVWLTY